MIVVPAEQVPATAHRRSVATWITWDEPNHDAAVAQWKERQISVVFPLRWAARRGQVAMIERAKERITEMEGKTKRHLVPGCVLLAFSKRDPMTQTHQTMNPDVSKRII